MLEDSLFQLPVVARTISSVSAAHYSVIVLTVFLLRVKSALPLTFMLKMKICLVDGSVISNSRLSNDQLTLSNNATLGIADIIVLLYQLVDRGLLYDVFKG